MVYYSDKIVDKNVCFQRLIVRFFTFQQPCPALTENKVGLNKSQKIMLKYSTGGNYPGRREKKTERKVW